MQYKLVRRNSGRLLGLLTPLLIGGCLPTAKRAWFIDADGDGYGDWQVEWYSVLSRETPTGYVDNRWDCDDSDSSVNALAPERCANGRDDDCDGLMDCEDDDCETDPSCVERVCDDDLDDDGDGRVDCTDDDCWGTAACIDARTLRARVLSGRAQRDQARAVWLASCYAKATSFGPPENELRMSRQLGHTGLHATNVIGSLAIETSAGTATCAWGISAGGWRVTREDAILTGQSMAAVEVLGILRSGFWIDDDCPISTSGFLPDRLEVESISAAGSLGWYAPLGRWHRSGTDDYGYFSSADPLGEGERWYCHGETADSFSYRYATLQTGDTFTVHME